MAAADGQKRRVGQRLAGHDALTGFEARETQYDKKAYGDTAATFHRMTPNGKLPSSHCSRAEFFAPAFASCRNYVAIGAPMAPRW